MNSEQAGAPPVRWVGWAMALIGLCVFSFAVYRAHTASFTHDESYSYDYFPHQPIGDILAHKEAFTNNHLLNTVGMKYAEQWFGTSELALRAPNLLLFAVYLLYAGLLVRRCAPWCALAAFVLLCTCRDVVEVFTLARGYGLSIGFMLMALFHLVRASEQRRTIDLLLFHVAALLATLSNFTLINVYVPGVLAHTLITAFQGADRYRMLRTVGVHAAMAFLAGCVLWRPVRRLLQENKLDFGGKQGFFQSTVRSVSDRLLTNMERSDAMVNVVAGLLVLVVLLALAVVLVHAWRKDRAFFTQHIALAQCALVLVLTCLASALQHALFGTDHLEDRFALFLIPLVLLVVVFLMDHLRNARNARAMDIGLIALALASTAVFVQRSGPYTSREWAYDANTKDVMRALVIDHARRGEGAVRIGNVWSLEPSINFYREAWHLDWLSRAHRQGIQSGDDYRYLELKDTAEWDTANYVCVQVFQPTGVVLLRRKDR
ncbi:MAG TPA: glycosyltransferase family 39 protein [Flavobacteriales bacterium]|nr:glycosyltransferase family 39 protein [Flavobacteriales bacterium]